jgi:outer membrane protein assembly factor BamB
MPRLVLPVLLTVAAGIFAHAPDPSKESLAHWPQWRGPSGQGYANDDRVPLTWGETENVLWKTELPGKGNSSPIVWGDRVFLTSAGERGAVRTVMCVRTTDGKLLWERVAAKDVPTEKTHEWNGHASPSCVTDGKHVWAFFGTPGLFCYDLDGNLIWKKTFGIFHSAAGWGTAASPFLYEDTVILNCDNDGGRYAAPSALVALEKATGKVRWSTPRVGGRGFSTPRLMKVANGRTDLVLNGPVGVWGYDPATGKERWRCDRDDPNDRMRFGEPMPVDDGSRMFIASGRDGPYQILKLPGDGNVTSTHILHAGVRKGHRDVSSPIVWQGHVYAVDNKGVLSCYDFETGKEIYSGLIGNRRNRSLGSPIALQGKLLWPLDDGTTVVVQPGPKLRVVGRNKLPGEDLDFGASPAVANGRLFLRSQSWLWCIGRK